MAALSPSRPPTHYSCRKQLQRHEYCYLDPQALWKIESGFVRTISSDEEGEIVSLGIWGAGELISTGFSPLAPLQLDCLQPTCLSQVSGSTLHNCDFLINRLLRSEELLYILHTRDTLCRLRKFLVWLAKRFGQPISLGMSVPLYLTHQELAEFIGSSRVTVTRLMNQLQQNGDITLHEQRTIVTSTALES